MSGLLPTLLLSLGLTLLLEVPLALLFGARGRQLLLVVLVNIMTNPAVGLLYQLSFRYTRFNSLAVLAVLEVSAVLVEFVYYKKYNTFRHPFLFSLAANAFSFGVGLLINRLI